MTIQLQIDPKDYSVPVDTKSKIWRVVKSIINGQADWPKDGTILVVKLEN